MKKRDKRTPVSTTRVEIHCLARYDVRVTVPLGGDGLSGDQIESLLHDCAFESADARGDGIFTLSSGGNKGSKYVVIEVPSRTKPASMNPRDTTALIDRTRRYLWVALVWKRSLFLRTDYGSTESPKAVDFPPTLKRAVRTLRRAVSARIAREPSSCPN